MEYLLFAFGILLIATILAFYRRYRAAREAARQQRIAERLAAFTGPRLMEVRHKQAPLYGDRRLATRPLGGEGGAPEKIEPASEQAASYDRWLLRDEMTDYTKAVGFGWEPVVDEPNKNADDIRSRLNALRERNRKGGI